MPKPLKRSLPLIPISREHHHGLLLAWKIREGIKNKISVDRIKKYTDWFWKKHLNAHFEFEEKYIFPILGNENALIKRALQEHEKLKELFSSSKENLLSIENEISSHIRFEERILFEEIESMATATQLKLIESAHSEITNDDWHDEFWLKK